MRHRNPDSGAIAALLERARTVAVFGLSSDHGRPSFGVARAMRAYGYRIVPVNPEMDRREGEPAFPTLAAAARGPLEGAPCIPSSGGARRGPAIRCTHRYRRRVPAARARGGDRRRLPAAR